MKRVWTKDQIELIKELRKLGLFRLSTQIEVNGGYRVTCKVCEAQGFGYNDADGYNYQQADHKDGCLADEIAHIDDVEKENANG